MTARGVVVPINNNMGSLMLGADFEDLFRTGGAQPTPNTLILSDRIELRADPTVGPLNTGPIFDVNSARVISGEIAGGYGSFFAQGEYYNYHIDRSVGGAVNFQGYYAQASYVLTGEARKYDASCGCYGTINPRDPVWAGINGNGGGYGAWEIAARYTHVNLNDMDVLGGVQDSATVGVNWYVNSNMRFMFNWITGRVEKNNIAGTDTGARYNAFAVRSQYAF